MIQLIVVIALVGLLVWGIREVVPMPAQFQRAILVLAVVGLVIYVLSYFGLLDGSFAHYHAHRC